MPILVVDDDAVSRHEIAELLRQDGYEVITAVNGREALKILRGGDCRLVIADWMMPEVTGINLCRQIRSGDFGFPVYVLIVTALNDPRDANLAIASGANDFVSKPLNRAEFLAKVRAGEQALLTATAPAAVAEAACGD